MEQIYLTKLTKQGTSLGIIIPKQILNGFKWERGDHLIFSFAENEQLCVRRLTDVEINKLKMSPDIAL